MNDDMKLQAFTLKTFSFDGAHTGDNIAREVKTVLLEFGWTNQTVVCVSDGGSNMIKAFTKVLKFPRQECVAHGLHRLVVHDFIDHPSQSALKNIITKLKQINQKIIYKKVKLEEDYARDEEKKLFQELVNVATRI
uniref:DUF659 domain-containing protein n=1 Tax=Phlebotomus papatasi TaxID=29031 RepID=A0A1B0EZU0_PHLPP